MHLNKDIVHEISNYLHQIISNAEHISKSGALSEYGQKIKGAAYSIDALISDVTVKKMNIDVSRASKNVVDLGEFAGLNVLIVDDLVENINIMENIFNTLSSNIVSAQSGREAIEIFNAGFTPNIVCMDIIMPGIDGSRTTKELKELGCDAYFIAISALKNQSSSIVSLFDCWLPKPFTLEHINGALSGYNNFKSSRVLPKSYKLADEISKEMKDKIFVLARDGAYSKLESLINTLDDSESKKFLLSSLKKIDLESIMKSIVAP